MQINEFLSVLEDEFDFIESRTIKADSLLYETLGASSLNLLFLRAIIDEHFDITLNDNDIKESKTIQDLYTKIQLRLENKTS